MTPSPCTAADPFEVIRSPSGVEVHLLRTAKYKTVLVLWMLQAPLDEGRSARALLPDLLTRGTARSPDMAAMAARCEELYNTDLIASVSAVGPLQVLRLGAETIADRYAGGRPLFDEVVDLLAEAIHEPAFVDGRFREDHLAQERSQLERAIASLADDKQLYAYRSMIEAMHAGTAFARHSWGTIEGARAVDEAAAHGAWDWARTTAPARLVVVGDVSDQQVVDAAERLSRGAEREACQVVGQPPARPERAIQDLSEKQDLAQSKLAMGFRLPAERLTGPAAGLFAFAFGGGSHSRLFKRVRESESLAYGCGASTLVDSATLVVQAGVDAANAPRTRELVLDELTSLGRDGLSEDELELSRRAQLRRLTNLRDAPRDLVGFRLFGLQTGRTHVVDEAIAAVHEVTADDVAAIAAETELDTTFLLEGRSP